MRMTAEELHRCLVESVRVFDADAESRGFRALLEQGSAERLLADLLFIRLCADGHPVSRELPIGQRRAADLVLHGAPTLFIEAKQLHLKDGCQYAPGNLVKDLSRYGSEPCLGVLYITDERASTMSHFLPRFAGANRRARYDVPAVVAELRTYFGSVFPQALDRALLREFAEEGAMRLYGFVVAL